MGLAEPDRSARGSAAALGSANPSMGLPTAWRRSSWCSANSCVEIAELPDGVAIRDSKSPDTSPILTFSTDEWRSFLAGVKAGEFG